jgi:hypothetical protein
VVVLGGAVLAQRTGRRLVGDAARARDRHAVAVAVGLR